MFGRIHIELRPVYVAIYTDKNFIQTRRTFLRPANAEKFLKSKGLKTYSVTGVATRTDLKSYRRFVKGHNQGELL